MSNQFKPHFIEILRNDDIQSFENSIKYNPTLLTCNSGDFNVYQLCLIFGSVSILSYLDREGFSYFGESLDCEVLF